MRESRGPFRFFVWYTVILRSAGPAVLTILLVYGVMHSLFLPYFRSNIRESRKMVALELSRVAWGLIDGYYQRQLSGELSEEEAKSKAKERLRLLRYGPEGKDYFWITDYSPKIIMHPYRKDLEGKDPSEYAVEDRKLFREFAEKSKTTGFIEYRWQWKDNREKSRRSSPRSLPFVLGDGSSGQASTWMTWNGRSPDSPGGSTSSPPVFSS